MRVSVARAVVVGPSSPLEGEGADLAVGGGADYNKEMGQRKTIRKDKLEGRPLGSCQLSNSIS